MKKGPLLVAGVLLAVQVTAIVATRRDFQKRTPRVFPEMADGPAYKTQSANPVLPHGMTQQPPVPGTVPRGFQPDLLGPSSDDRKLAGQQLVNPVRRTLAALERGKYVYENYCLHCHGADGEGTGGVARRIPAFSMPINGKASRNLPDGELFHIVTWGRNNMPPHRSQLSQSDRWRVVHYLRDLQGAEYDRQDGGPSAGDPRTGSFVTVEYGKELYLENCAPCHGEDGRTAVRGTPTLNNPRVLAIAASDFYLDIITHGRKGTQMPAWDDKLTTTQIQSVVAFIRSWAGTAKDPGEMRSRHGSIADGRALFRGNCAPCHGLNGEGGIGNSLSAPSFLALASEEFLRQTIAGGRSHTAMPAGTAFETREISDILSYMQSWKSPRSSLAEVRQKLAEGANDRIGKRLYDARCASCHGREGEGGIGPNVSGDDWLSMVDDEFLYRSIVDGRPGTAMPSWYMLTSEDVADLISFMRTWQKSEPRNLSRARRQGRPEFGEMLYNQGCRACHGPEGAGGLGNQIANPIFLESVSDEFLWQIIARGKEGTAMRGFLRHGAAGAMMPMSASDIDHVIAYLRDRGAAHRLRPVQRRRPNPSIAAGKAVYDGVGACAKCHGDQGQGASGPSLANPEFLATASDGFLLGTMVLGRENTEMLSYYRGGNVNLSRREMEDVVAYVRSFGNTPPTTHREVPRTPSIVAEGAQLFFNHCAGCHGTEGKGPDRSQRFAGYAPSINNNEFLHAADDGFLLATIALGRTATPMRPFAKGAGGISDLTTEEIRKIVAYIRSWEKDEETQ